MFVVHSRVHTRAHRATSCKISAANFTQPWSPEGYTDCWVAAADLEVLRPEAAEALRPLSRMVLQPESPKVPELFARLVFFMFLGRSQGSWWQL